MKSMRKDQYKTGISANSHSQHDTDNRSKNATDRFHKQGKRTHTEMAVQADLEGEVSELPNLRDTQMTEWKKDGMNQDLPDDELNKMVPSTKVSPRVSRENAMQKFKMLQTLLQEEINQKVDL